MIAAALLGSSPEVKRGIYNNIVDAFQLKDLNEISSRADFMDALPAIAARSKDFFLLSSKYFDTESGGYVQVFSTHPTMSLTLAQPHHST